MGSRFGSVQVPQPQQMRCCSRECPCTRLCPVQARPAECGFAQFSLWHPGSSLAPLVPAGQPQLPACREHSCCFEGVAGATWVSLHLMAAQAPNKAEREETQSFPKLTFPAPGLPSKVAKAVTLVLSWSELSRVSSP